MDRTGRASRLLAFLSWLDAIERIDTLILEIRHVQETIASQLHEHKFYDVLRYEDYYLWGTYTRAVVKEPSYAADTSSTTPNKEEYAPQDWSKILLRESGFSLSHDCTMLALAWCPEYPAASDTTVEFTKRKEELLPYHEWFDFEYHLQIEKDLKAIRTRISTENRFSVNDDRLYDGLRYLQLIKRDLLRDKLVLAHRALTSFRANRDQFGAAAADFLIVRRAALYSLNLRLEAFRDILSMVQEILNLSMERDPPPTVRRRRDQGIYTTDLADNCRYIDREIRSFFDYVKHGTLDSAIRSALSEDIEFIIHRYNRHHTSTYRYESIWSKHSAVEDLRNVGAGFVRSSFWMPERPDLQPIIAHEIAHVLLRSRAEDLSPVALDGMSDPLGRLLRNISYAFETTAPQIMYYNFTPRVRESLVREVACDLIGIAVHGTAYLFAHFLELIGVGFEKLVVAQPKGDIAQNVNSAGEEYITFLRDDQPEWFIRLSISLSFWRATLQNSGNRASYLQSIIDDGMTGILEAAHQRFSSWMDGNQREDWDTWIEMTNVLNGVVAKSDLAKLTSRWGLSRTKRAMSHETQEWNDVAFNRYAVTLPEVFSTHCLGAWLDRLVEEPRMLGRLIADQKNYPCYAVPHELDYESIISEFRRMYLGISNKTTVQRALQKWRKPEKKLFNHLIDIPWQTAILTAHDFLGSPECEQYAIPQPTWLTGIHQFNWLGRDLYHCALEYVIWYERTPIGRIKAMNRWLVSISKIIFSLRGQRPGDSQLEKLNSIVSTTLGARLDEKVDDQGFLERKAPSLRAAFDNWTATAERETNRFKIVGEAVLIGSQATCQFHPNNSRKFVTIEGEERRKWVHFFDYLATLQMDQACESINRHLVQFFDEAPASLIEEIGKSLKRPAADSDRRANPCRTHEEAIIFAYGRVVFELIRIAHYLQIRPEALPIGPVAKHHKGASKWEDVFAKYLDVPIHGRKVKGGKGSCFIEELVPSRSIRVDRFSHMYEPHISSEARKFRDDGSLYPGHSPADIIKPTPAPLWRSWGLDGVRPNEKQEPTSNGTLMAAPLLGRFDLLTLDMVKHTARFTNYSPSVTYFRRQQIGMPFSAQTTCDGEIVRAEKHEVLPSLFQTNAPEKRLAFGGLRTPLATLSVLLVQRSARLTFVERLVAEDRVVKSFHPGLESSYRYFDPQSDIGLLTDGWGDIFLVLFGLVLPSDDQSFSAYVNKCNALKKRFSEVITFRKAVFEDTLVVRSETSYTPLAVDTALLNPREFRCTISIRFRSTVDGRSLADEFENHLNDLFFRRFDGALSKLLAYSSVSGRTDYVISTKRTVEDGVPEATYELLCRGCKSFNKYGILFETLRKLFFEPPLVREHVDMTATSIAELDFWRH